MLTPRHIRQLPGFTLIEMMVSIAILGILAMIAMPSFKEYMANVQIKNVGETIIYGMQLARSEAVKRNKTIRFELDATGSGWTVCEPNADGTGCGTQIHRRETAEGSSNAIVVTPQDGRAYHFSGYGTMTTSISNSYTWFNVNVPSMATGKTRNLRVTLSIDGMARLCDPNSGSGTPQACPALPTT